MTDLVFQSAHQLARAVRERKVSATEVLEAHLAQIALHNPKLNAIVTLDEERARRRAKEADEAIARGENWGLLHGVPVTIKDFYATAGLRTTCSYKPLANYIPQQDATVVARLRSAGAIILGKTNLPVLGLGIQTDSPLFGRTNNPWNLNYTPGGSTGGGAAAVAAGLSPLELGGDGGGSIRLPSHFCGVFGLKPTEHRVSLAGLVLGLPGGSRGWRHLTVAGPLARSVEDLRLCLSLIEGSDNREWEVPPAPVENATQRPLSQYRFAFSDEFGGVPVTAETREAIKKLAVTLEQMGCRVEYRNPPNFNFVKALLTYGEIAGAESVAAVSGLERLRWRMLSLVPSRVVNAGPVAHGFARGGALNMRWYTEALTRRDALIGAMQEFLSDWDAWICPVAAGSAFTHRQMMSILGSPLEVDNQKLPYWVWGISYTAVFNLTGNPVVAMPFGQTKEGLPIGVQVVGRRWRDMELLSVAQKLTEVTGVCQRPPGY